MRILGITDGQTSGAAIVENGRLLAAVNEERIVRIKMARGFPWESIREVMALSGTEPRDLAGVAVAQINMEFREKIDGWPGWFEAREEEEDVHSAFFRVAGRFGQLASVVPGLKRAYYSVRSPVYARRRKRIREILSGEFAIEAPLEFIDHHFAHATSAYYTSNFEDALVVTLDGGGDRASGHVYSVRGDRWEKLHKSDSYDSLGNYYAYVTALCGFKAKRHEGKITGLAARGRPIYENLFRSLIDVEQGCLVNRGKVLFTQALERIRSELPPDWRREDLSASIQKVAEDHSRAIVRHWLERSGQRHVALAGGLFANVRVNEEIHLLPALEGTFVHPGMSDEGLAVGAALALDAERRRARGERWEPRRLDDVYLGHGYDEREIAAALERAGLSAEHHPGAIEPLIAERLAEGKVVARFNGKMEYGPRALGNRSILYQPNDPSVNDWLNELLRRTEFMPFAPSTLWEHAGELYRESSGALDTARFMTVTFHCTPPMIERASGVVHVDDTARPQLVCREDNPSYHRIISEYHRRTGTPTIINTSFNIHEEPIVRSPDDAIRAFLDSKLDYLAMGDFIVQGPAGSMETRKKWEGKSKWARRAVGTGSS